MKQIPSFIKRYGALFDESRMVEQLIPRVVSSPTQLHGLNPHLLRNQADYQRAELTAINEGLAAPIYDLLDRGGKKWRPVLGMVFAECFNRDVAASIERGDFEKHRDVLFVCGLTEIVHNGSLMADDLEDKSLMRRGQPCTYLKYGDDYAVNGSSFMYFAPMSKVGEFIPDPKLQLSLTNVYLREMLNLHYG